MVPKVATDEWPPETVETALGRAMAEYVGTPVALDHNGNLTDSEWLRVAMRIAHAADLTWDLHRPNLEWDPRKPPLYGEIDCAVFRGGDLTGPHVLEWDRAAVHMTLRPMTERSCVGCAVCGQARPDVEDFEREEYERLRAKFGG